MAFTIAISITGDEKDYTAAIKAAQTETAKLTDQTKKHGDALDDQEKHIRKAHGAMIPFMAASSQLTLLLQQQFGPAAAIAASTLDRFVAVAGAARAGGQGLMTALSAGISAALNPWTLALIAAAAAIAYFIDKAQKAKTASEQWSSTIVQLNGQVDALKAANDIQRSGIQIDTQRKVALEALKKEWQDGALATNLYNDHVAKLNKTFDEMKTLQAGKIASDFEESLVKQNAALAAQLDKEQLGARAAAEWAIAVAKADAEAKGLTPEIQKQLEIFTSLTRAIANTADQQQRWAEGSAFAKSVAEGIDAEKAARLEEVAAIEKMLEVQQQLDELEAQRLRALGLEQAAQQVLLQTEIKRAQLRAGLLNDFTDVEGVQSKIDIANKQSQVAQAHLQHLGEVSINVGHLIADNLGNAFSSVIDGTMKLSDVGKTLFASIQKTIGQFFIDAMVKKLGFENQLFTNLRGLVPAANNAVQEGANSTSGGSGILGFLGNLFGGNGSSSGGGGFLSNIGGFFTNLFGSNSSSGGGGGFLSMIGNLFSSSGSSGGGGGFLGMIGNLFSSSGSSGGGGFLSNLFGSGSSFFNARPEGVSGPLMENGGFFSNGGWGGFASGAAGIVGAIANSITQNNDRAPGGIKMASSIIGMLSTVLTVLYSNPWTAIVAAVAQIILAIVGNNLQQPFVRIKPSFSGFGFDNATGMFSAGNVASKIGASAGIGGSEARGIRDGVTEALQKQADLWVEVLNLFPAFIRQKLIPSVEIANQTIDNLLKRGFKFSPGGSQDIGEELQQLANLTAPRIFFSGLKGTFGEGITQALAAAGFGSLAGAVGDFLPAAPTDVARNQLKKLPGLAPPKKAKDMNDFITAFSEFVGFTGSIAGMAPGGITAFMTDQDQALFEKQIGKVLAVKKGEDLAKTVDAFKKATDPLMQFLQSAIQQAQDLMGRGITAALDAASESTAMSNFLKAIGDGTQQVIFDGIVQAFLASAQFNDLLAPIQKTIREFTQHAIDTQTPPDLAALRTALLPEIEALSTRAELLQPLIAELNKLGIDIKDALSGLTGSGNNNITITINGDISGEDDVTTLANKIAALLTAGTSPS